jgi:hypothetical protein
MIGQRKKEIFVGGRSSGAPGATSTCSYLVNRCQEGLFLLGFNMGKVGMDSVEGERDIIGNVLPYFKLPNQGNFPLCKFGSVRTVFSGIGKHNTFALSKSDHNRRI